MCVCTVCFQSKTAFNRKAFCVSYCLIWLKCGLNAISLFMPFEMWWISIIFAVLNTMHTNRWWWWWCDWRRIYTFLSHPHTAYISRSKTIKLKHKLLLAHICSFNIFSLDKSMHTNIYSYFVRGDLKIFRILYTHILKLNECFLVLRTLCLCVQPSNHIGRCNFF